MDLVRSGLSLTPQDPCLVLDLQTVLDMSLEVDSLLQEAKESIEAAQNYRSELQQRLQGLNQARKQVRQDP